MKNDVITDEPIIEQSIAKRLLTIVFSIYVLIALLMTTIHMIAEYEKAKLDVLAALKIVHETMSPGIASALWDVNNQSLKTSVTAMTNLPDVGGVIITGHTGKLNYIAGTILDNEGNPIQLKPNHSTDTSITRQTQFSYSAPIIYVDQYDKEELGSITIFAEEDASFNRVSFGFGMIIINSLIKTVALWIIFLWVSKPVLHHPLRKLTKAVNNLNPDSRHYQDLNVGISGNNELGILQRAFNNLIHKINHSMLALENANALLEKRVQERTEDLQKKNRELLEAYETLEDLSTVDPLTGWRNRRYFNDHIPYDTSIATRDYMDWKAKGSKSPAPTSDLVFFLIDLDHFKSVNDDYGHAAGDDVLKQLCKLLKSICRESDYCVRWGGEEFLIVSRFVNRNDAPLFAERIIRIVDDYEFTINTNQSIHKTCSLGFSSFPFCRSYPEAFSWSDSITMADKALYAAKDNGRNAWVGLTCNEEKRTRENKESIINQTSDQIASGNLLATTSLSTTSTLAWPSNH